MDSSRALALAALGRWRQGTEFADRIVADSFKSSALSAADRAFGLELFYGVLRNLTLLDFWIAQLRSAPVALPARDLLRLGLYQVLLIETAPHAAVNETVNLAGKRLRPLVNAVLRRSAREKSHLIEAAAAQPLAVRFSVPAFLLEKWWRQFPADEVLELCQWNNRPAPVYARVNQHNLTPGEFLARYPQSTPFLGRGNFVALPQAGQALAQGDCYVQDPSTALACKLLQPRAGESVLDACAAPGGKTAYLAEIMSTQGLLVAVDREEARLGRLRENFVRLDLPPPRMVRCDWLDERSVRAAGLEAESFDRILVDAPCSNTGVMRRRVDVRWRLRPADFERMPRLQVAILRAVAPMLKPGGSLVYSTCSLEREENEDVMETFLREQPYLRLAKVERSLPFRDGVDGAFAARLEAM